MAEQWEYERLWDLPVFYGPALCQPSRANLITSTPARTRCRLRKIDRLAPFAEYLKELEARKHEHVRKQ